MTVPQLLACPPQQSIVCSARLAKCTSVSFLQVPSLTDDLVQRALNPAALLPAGHPIGAAEPTPLFRCAAHRFAALCSAALLLWLGACMLPRCAVLRCAVWGLR